MKPILTSVTITFVKDQFSDGSVMELMALLSDGQILQKTVPQDGKTLRLDAEFFLPSESTSEKAAE